MGAKVRMVSWPPSLSRPAEEFQTVFDQRRASSIFSRPKLCSPVSVPVGLRLVKAKRRGVSSNWALPAGRISVRLAV